MQCNCCKFTQLNKILEITLALNEKMSATLQSEGNCAAVHLCCAGGRTTQGLATRTQ